MAKSKTLRGLGPKYGIKLRKQYTKVHQSLKAKRVCPDCGSSQVGREAVGIWLCYKCGFKIAGTAYDIKL